MVLLERLQIIANRLGLIRVVVEKGAGSTAPKVATRTMSLKDLAAEIRAADVRALAALPAEMTVEFDRVFETAGIAPKPHGWTIHRLAQLLRTDQYKSMDRDAAQTAVLGVLSADQATVEDLVEDALARDQALDAYEQFVQGKMDARQAARERQALEINQQLRELEEERARLDEQAATDTEQWRAWLQRKREAEDELAWAVGYLLDEPLITREGDVE